jgi:hypothetical protein
MQSYLKLTSILAVALKQVYFYLAVFQEQGFAFLAKR